MEQIQGNQFWFKLAWALSYRGFKLVRVNSIFLLLQERGVSFVNVDEYPLELIPLDSDVLSLEMESSFKVSK